ncbi:DUF3014 domain-containing protein [Pseudoalteromonas sp. BDTF-M6]|uniref:DUF3014 domain-containing protein n=1 Tax=Pseudoalteromonas sp. BDTF-M6 TaxID=2796132 RepID=UPI001BB0B502|nr:DUF3014 domain-containing protein [Pseudoalteromonas sp. BDTF-M6]MBS3798680.1 DUF3014 domain-containing protein [Pseudoalteromonas sp. BDTF-M6]
MKEQPPEQDTKTPNRNTLLFAAIVVVVLVIVVVIALSNQQQPTEPAPVAEPKEVVIEPQEPEPELEPQPTPEPVQPEPVQPEPEPVMEEPLPSLDDSDAEVSERVEQSLAASSAELLVNDDLIRRTVVFVNNLAAGRVATNHSPVTKLQEPFSVVEGDVLTMDPQSFKRYDPYVAILTALDSEQLLALYKRFEPLFVEAYGEVGEPGTSFEQRLVQAIDLVLATPEMTTQIPLLRDSVTYKYAYSEWENLPPAQKQLLRMGPENVAKVKGVLRELRAQLD